MRWPAALLIGVFAAQAAFWHHSKTIFPDMGVVPPVPGKAEAGALSLGDGQFYFRLLALQIQNCGDTYGRFTALYQYDFQRLYQWFLLLDRLDNRSDLVPTMASYYFSQTQNKPDVRYIYDYLMQHVKGREKQKWWWAVQATYLANHVLEDKDLALAAARSLEHVRGIPLWAQQMPAFIHEQRGEMEAALAIMEAIARDEKNIPPSEMKFMEYFVKERLKRLDRLAH